MRYIPAKPVWRSASYSTMATALDRLSELMRKSSGSMKLPQIS